MDDSVIVGLKPVSLWQRLLSCRRMPVRDAGNSKPKNKELRHWVRGGFSSEDRLSGSIRPLIDDNGVHDSLVQDEGRRSTL
jgi:hypothetical protein